MTAKADTNPLREALERIASSHACGCKPCTGQCTSQEALSIAIDEMRDIARAARAALASEPVAGTVGREEIQTAAFKLSCHDQFDLAFKIAENVGYVLTPEPAHPDSPHTLSAPPALAAEDIGREAEELIANSRPAPAGREEIARIIEEKMLDAWNDICSDTDCHPLDIKQLGKRELEFKPAHWSRATALSSAYAILALGATVSPQRRGSVDITDHSVYFACESCEQHKPEGAVRDRSDIAVMPDGTWLCSDCYSDCEKTAYGLVASDIDDFEFPDFDDLPRPTIRPTPPAHGAADRAEWQPIETAPKEEGHHVLLHGSGDNFTNCSFVGYWTTYGGLPRWQMMSSKIQVWPVLWMPIPTALAPANTGETGR